MTINFNPQTCLYDLSPGWTGGTYDDARLWLIGLGFKRGRIRRVLLLAFALGVVGVPLKIT